MFKNITKRLQPKVLKIWQKTTRFVDRKPVASFLMLLVVLVSLIAFSNVIRRPQTSSTEIQKDPKQVSVYRIGTVPKIKLQAQIEKSGVITITALGWGIVQTINHTQGEYVEKGAQLLSLSTNYQGGNALSLARQSAQAQNKNTEESYPDEKKVISKKRDIAKIMDENNEELREIARASIVDTEEVIRLNDEILATLDQQLSIATESAVILGTKQIKSQYLSGNYQLKSALRNAQYQGDDDAPPSDLSHTTRDMTLRQLSIQEKALELSLEISRLNVRMAQINEGIMYPASPFSGVIQKVHVKVGQAVSPGMPLFTFSQEVKDDPATAIAYVTHDIARRVSLIEPSILFINDSKISEVPSFVTTDAIAGTLYGIFFAIPENLTSSVVEKGFITVEVPVGYADTSGAVPFVPLDSLYRTESQSFVFVAVDNRAESRQVTLGSIVGRFVQISNGLDNADAVILDRTVVSGDPLSIVN